jgi:hypothetical protein
MLREWIEKRIVNNTELSEQVLQAKTLGDLVTVLRKKFDDSAGKHIEQLYYQETKDSHNLLSSMREILSVVQSTENHGVFRLRNIQDLAKKAIDQSTEKGV